MRLFFLPALGVRKMSTSYMKDAKRMLIVNLINTVVLETNISLG